MGEDAVELGAAAFVLGFSSLPADPASRERRTSDPHLTIDKDCNGDRT
jgi:hypothetical protein